MYSKFSEMLMMMIKKDPADESDVGYDKDNREDMRQGKDNI